MSFQQWWKTIGVARFQGYSDAELVSMYGVCMLAWNNAIVEASKCITEDGNPVVAKDKVLMLICGA